jgi:hypothetical protein
MKPTAAQLPAEVQEIEASLAWVPPDGRVLVVARADPAPSTEIAAATVAAASMAVIRVMLK